MEASSYSRGGERDTCTPDRISFSKKKERRGTASKCKVKVYGGGEAESVLAEHSEGAFMCG